MSKKETDFIELYKSLRDNSYSHKAAFNICLAYLR